MENKRFVIVNTENNMMTKDEEEYTLRMLNEALSGKTYPVTPELLREMKKKREENLKLKNQKKDVNKA